MEISDWRNKYFFFQKKNGAWVFGIYTGGHVKYNWDDYVINYWFLVTAPVSYQSNQWSELWQSSTGRCWLDVPTNSQNSDVHRNGQWRRINSLNTENGEGYNVCENISTPLNGWKNLNSSLPFKQSAVKFSLPWASFSLCIFIFSWRTTCLGPWTLGKWQWKVRTFYLFWTACVSSPAVVIKVENIEIYDFTSL